MSPFEIQNDILTEYVRKVIVSVSACQFHPEVLSGWFFVYLAHILFNLSFRIELSLCFYAHSSHKEEMAMVGKMTVSLKVIYCDAWNL